MSSMKTRTGGWFVGNLRTAAVAAPREIIKMGGSLLSVSNWPDLAAEIVRVRSGRKKVLVVVGGGAIVDGLRTIDAAAPQRADTTHFLAIDLLGATARLVARVVGLPLVVEPGDAPAAVLDVPPWLAAAARRSRLPAGWHVTSDSIAALVAAEARGDLLLAKRVPPPPSAGGDRIAELARSGWVDEHFPTAAAGLRHIAWAAPRSVPVPVVGGPLGEGGDAGGG
ncbi:MAG: hypothetical protein EBZ59_08160 [Planctomycetia bacterium]|nr:hypothetical protein [Planctomycetia bacterium]